MENSSFSILVVDDNEMNRDVLSRRLTKMGYEVTLACDGQEALDLMNFEAYDIVLLDIMMPVVDGIAALKKIKENPQLSDIPVIMLTALSDSSSVRTCIELGAKDYLIKPLNMAKVKARIQSCLNGED